VSPERLLWLKKKKLDEFLVFKKAELKEIKDRLETLRDRESTLSGPIGGDEIEWILQELAERAGARDWKLQISSAIAKFFPLQERKMLFEWLNEIEEKAPWGPRRRWRRPSLLQRQRVRDLLDLNGLDRH